MTRNPMQKRQGAALVEMAIVISIFILFLFGILEYGRFIFTQQVIFNATREGARYAVANVNDTTVDTDTIAYVKTKMAGVDKMTSSYSCSVYAANSSGTNIGATSTASFGTYICVEVNYLYKPIFGNILGFTSTTYNMVVKDLMYSEAN